MGRLMSAPTEAIDTSRVTRNDLSVMFPVSPVDPTEVETFAKFVDLAGLQRLYMGQGLVFETHTTLARLVGSGIRIPLGTAVTLMPMRHPVLAAMHARELAAFTDQRYVAGLGMGSRQFVDAVGGGWPASPLGYTREYATIVRSLLETGAVDLQGKYFQVRTRLDPQMDVEVDLALGVLRPAMTRLAGEIADIGISWLTPPEYCAEQLVPALEKGGADRDRRARLAAVVAVAVDRPGRDPVELAKAGLMNHLRAPHYGDALQKAGYDIRIGDAEHNAREIVERGLYVCGSPSEIADALAEYKAAGVDDILLNAGGVRLSEGPVAALTDLNEIVEAIGS